MGPDPFNMPAVGGAQNNDALLQQSVAGLAPLATQWHGPTTGSPIATIQPDLNNAAAKGGVVAQFGHFIGGVTDGIGHITGGVASWLGRNAVAMVEAPFKFTYDFTTGAYRTWEENNQVNALIAKQQNLTKQWQSGDISDQSYRAALKDIMAENDQLGKNMTVTQQRLQNSRGEGINTAATILTLLTGPLSKALTSATGAGATARFLTSVNANAFLDTTERAITKVASDPELFAQLSPTMQKVIQQSTAEVVAGSASNMTAGQLARTAAVNLALKYPLYYNYFSTTGNSIYNELDQGKYGAATRQLAFNAALILSGGPIGWALGKAGKGVGAVMSKTFGQTSFLDTLSKAIGEGGDNMNGDGAGLYKAIMNLPESERADVIKQMSAIEATNMVATGGDPVAAAMRVIKGMENYEGMSLSQFSHEEALNNMVNFAKAQRLADEAGKAAGIGPVTVGRVDARALQTIAAKLTSVGQLVQEAASKVEMSPAGLTPKQEGLIRDYPRVLGADDKQALQALGMSSKDLNKLQSQIEAAYAAKDLASIPEDKGIATGVIGGENVKPSGSMTQDRLQAWEDLKAQNPSQAWANNENFDRQIKALINKYDDPAQLQEAIANIKAQFKLGSNKFPAQIAGQLEKMGYIPIKPGNLEAPFTEGSGQLVTKFTEDNNNFFLKAVQPLPILSYMGDAMVRMGLSPNATQSRLYQVFNDNLASNLSEAVPALVGEEKTQTADTLIKRLSEYAHNPTRGRIVSHMPITDLRMMTTSDIKTALGVDIADARKIQTAISQSYLQVPLALRGLGDRLVDRTYQLTGPAARRYFRIQGAARFAWNPFFQYLRVVPKTETLASFEGGGFINALWNGRLGELKNVRQELRNAGILDERSNFGNVIGGEAVDQLGVTSPNLYRKLLPAQENSIAGLVMSQADRMGMDYKTYIQQNPSQVADTVQAIAQYDRKANFLNSPLLRTMNIAFFPLRFETKVATIMAKSLAQTDLMTQVSVVNGMLRFHSWINSAEGQAWYARNAQAISFFEYITPMSELNSVFEALVPGQNHALGNFGQLGGLPFGWIPQLLDSEGITHFSPPAVDSNTGAIYGQYIPTTSRGQVAIAIQDLISNMFTWPGASLGLPSKSKATAAVSFGLLGGSRKTDAQYVTPPASSLSPQLQDYQQTIEQLAGTAPGGGQAPQGGAEGQAQITPGVSVPAQRSPAETSPRGSSGSRSGGRLRKSQFKPELLPGQTQLGQLP